MGDSTVNVARGQKLDLGSVTSNSIDLEVKIVNVMMQKTVC